VEIGRFYKICLCLFLMKSDKRGLVGWIILGVIVVILLVVIVVGVYFYNFYVFKTVRICVGEGEDMMLPCEGVQDCIDAAEANEIGTDIDLSDAPEFIQGKFQEVLDKVVYCDGTCFVKNVRGIDPETQAIEMLESCNEGEVEIVAEIRGKEGLEILKWMKAME